MFDVMENGDFDIDIASGGFSDQADALAEKFPDIQDAVDHLKKIYPEFETKEDLRANVGFMGFFNRAMSLIREKVPIPEKPEESAERAEYAK